MSGKYKKTYRQCKYSNYIEHLLVLGSAIAGFILISAFASLVCVDVGITSSAVGINICPITAGIIRYKSIIKKKKKIIDKFVLLEKDNLISIEVLNSEALVDSYISHDEFISINNFLREYCEMKEEM